MPARTRTPFGALALAALVAGTVALAQPPTADPLKKIDPPAKAPPKDAKPQAVKLPDGTFLWLGTGPDGERVTLSPQEYQKLVDRADALKKELAARKPVAPSSCAIKARIEKRGDQLVAALKLTYSFRTSHPNAAVALGGRKAFLVSAALDGAKLPVLETGDDGFAVAVEAAGDHALVLDAEAPVLGRAKGEVGFDLGLPRAPITALALEPPPGDVKRVTLVTRTEAGAKGTDPRRTVVLDAKQLAARDGGTGFPLGPVESIDVSWEPPAGGAPATDAVQSADFDIGVTLTEAFADTVAKVKLRGPAREWRLVAPPGTTEVTPERAAPGDVGPTLLPTITKPGDSKGVWKIELPPGSPASEWVFTVTARAARPKSGSKGSSVGPFAVLDVLKQSGTVRATAPAYTRLALKHGPELRRTEPPAGAPDTDDAPAAYFRLTTGPTGGAPPGAPLLTVDAVPVEGSVRVSPTYKLKLTEAGWAVRAEIAVRPARTEVESLTFDLPAEWRGLVVDLDQEPVAGATPGPESGAWRPVTIRLAAPQKKPFAVALSATVPVPPGARDLALLLPRFPKLIERDATATATVSDGLVVSGTARGWDGDAPAAFGEPLVPVPGPDGKVPKAVATATARAERGLARLALKWEPFRPDLTAEVRADVTVGERQLVVTQTVRLKSPDGFPKLVKFRGPPGALGLKPALESSAPGAWLFAPPPDAREATLRLTFALPLPAQPDGPLSVPAGLLWPADVDPVEATVRVWTGTARALGPPPAGWRELPPEPTAEREALPALTLAASGEQALALELRPAALDRAAGVWAERVLIEAVPTDDGGTAYRARFRLSRWLVPALEFELPDGAGAPLARFDSAAVPLVPAGANRYRAALPESAGRALVFDVQYSVPGARSAAGETAYRPPVLAGATFVGPVRWLVTEPASAAALVTRANGRAELRWRARGVSYAPTAPAPAAVERWFALGAEPAADEAATGAEGETVLVRQAAPAELRVARVPWLALVAGASLLAALAALALAQLPAAGAGAAVALLGGGFAVLAVLFPHPAAQALAAAQPGAAVGLLLVAAQAALRQRAKARVARLPGFSRVPAEPTGSAPAPQTTASSAARSSGQAAAPSGT